ncbi:polysaccharide deacetylase family protein [Roseobacter sp. S98]|uniref:polysaccharide deacetylase family protein n=1 Tax=Roseobacter algicola (ex Choi et al. 2025) (nom. illeg.) TaxID=3092138 RepID=UPI0035C74A29
MPDDWSPLRQELARCRADGVDLPVWWRDDDAVAHTPALDRLDALSAKTALPVHIAVIPRPADETLVRAVRNSHNLIPLVHGWQHVSHSPEGVKKAEFGQPRHGAIIELQAAIGRLHELFGTRLLPVFVPPWNRFDGGFCADLVRSGYGGISTFLPREEKTPAHGLTQVNTHIDPINWKGDRGLVSAQTLIDLTARTLSDRRTGLTDPSEPLGLLTHHLVHTEEVWQFSEKWIGEMQDGGARPETPLQQETPDEQA